MVSLIKYQYSPCNFSYLTLWTIRMASPGWGVEGWGPSFRALSERLKFTFRRHKFNEDSLIEGLMPVCAPLGSYLTELIYWLVLESQLPHKGVNVSLTITNIKNKLTDLCGICLLWNNFKNTLCQTRSLSPVGLAENHHSKLRTPNKEHETQNAKPWPLIVAAGRECWVSGLYGHLRRRHYSKGVYSKST